MKFSLEIDSENDALVGEGAIDEMVRILEDLAVLVCAGQDGGTVRDINGNAVGSWSLEQPDPDEDEDDEA